MLFRSAFYRHGDPTKVYADSEVVLDYRKQWAPLLTFTKIDRKQECFIALSIPFDLPTTSNTKLGALIVDNPFVRHHFALFQQLSKQELKILKLTCSGLNSKGISEKLSLSIHTVNTHRKAIREKLGVKNLSELYRFAFNFGLME